MRTRYFMLVYTALTKDGNKQANGNTYVESTGTFPNNKETQQYLENSNAIKDVVIQNIYEFKSEEDYRAFIRIPN